MEELLEKIPVEKRWEITAQAITRLTTLMIAKTSAPLLGKGEGVTSLILGREKHQEIQEKAFGKVGSLRLPWVKKEFNIQEDDAIGAAKAVILAAALLGGPEYKFEIVEASPERVVIKRPQCPWWNRYNELNIEDAIRDCPYGHGGWTEVGLQTLSPKLTYKLTKTMPWGDPYCEEVIEYKEE